MVGGYVLPRFSVSFPKTGFLLIPKRPEPPIEIFMGSAEVVYFADGFGDLIKNLQESLLLCCKRRWAGGFCGGGG